MLDHFKSSIRRPVSKTEAERRKMSAIFGIISHEDRPVDPGKLGIMAEALSHLGPDGCGLWIDGAFALGHQLFSISDDLKEERLPCFDSESGLAVTATARIDNHSELKKELESGLSSTVFAKNRLILNAYRKWGADSPCKLQGDFAFAVADLKTKTLFLATDPLGRTPVYYFDNQQVFLFATEIKGILAYPHIDTRLNLRKIALLSDLGLTMNDSENTFFTGIKKMPAASIMMVKDGRIKISAYWKPEIPPALKFKNAMDFAEAFQSVFEQSIQSRIRSSYPIAALCSGGLDSSAIVSMAARVLAKKNKQLHAFAAVLPEGYVGSGKDEREYIDVFKSEENIDLHYISSEKRGPFDDLDTLVWCGDSPLYTSRHYQYSAFADRAKALGCRILLDGVGGELGPSFHGYGIMTEWFLRGHWITLIEELRKIALVENRGLRTMVKSEIIKPLMPSFWWRRRLRFDFQQFSSSNPIRKSFVDSQLGIKHEDNLPSFKVDQKPLLDHRRNQLQRLILATRISGNNHYVGYSNVTHQFPYFDKPLLEFCMAAPAHFKISDGYKRSIIRLGMKGILPDKLRLRSSKAPFGPDYHDRYNRQRQEVLAWLSALNSADPVREIVDIEKLQSLTKHPMRTNRSRTPHDFAAMQTVPMGMYLIAFLKRFGAYLR